MATILGEYLPTFSKALLQDGQVYYLVSVTSNIIVAVITWTVVVPVAYRVALTIFNVAVTNMMACRVYRHTKFGYLRENLISTSQDASKIALRSAENSLGPRLPPCQVASPQHAYANVTTPQTFFRTVSTVEKYSSHGSVEPEAGVHRTSLVYSTPGGPVNHYIYTV